MALGKTRGDGFNRLAALVPPTDEEPAMKTLMITLALLSLGMAAHAADEKTPKAPTAQQTKMRACNAEARENKLKGDPRKAFMKSCLSSKDPAKQTGATQKKA